MLGWRAWLPILIGTAALQVCDLQGGGDRGVFPVNESGWF